MDFLKKLSLALKLFQVRINSHNDIKYLATNISKNFCLFKGKRGIWQHLVKNPSFE
jgi:hypothetical protein